MVTVNRDTTAPGYNSARHGKSIIQSGQVTPAMENNFKRIKKLDSPDKPIHRPVKPIQGCTAADAGCGRFTAGFSRSIGRSTTRRGTVAGSDRYRAGGQLSVSSAMPTAVAADPC